MRPQIFAAALAGLVTASPAAATWYGASSPHFIIYSQQKPEQLRSFATRLEKFDRAVRAVREMSDPPVGTGNRLTVFVVKSTDDVQRLVKDKSGMIAGFYVGRAAGSYAFVPRYTDSDWELDSGTVFFHEYSHHLMMQDLATPVPEWLVEGFAEFMSTARFERDGSVTLGQAPKHRAYGLVNWAQLPVETLLAGNYQPKTNEEEESLYGRGWLLTHYLTFEKSRRGQLANYLKSIAEGRPPLDATKVAFGDLKKLERDIDIYLMRPRLASLRIAASNLPLGAIQLSQVSGGTAAMLPLRMQLLMTDDGQGEPVAGKIRVVAAEFTHDPFAQETLAEAEIETKHYAAAEAAADRALAGNPRDGQAMVLKGRAIIEEAAAGSPNATAMFSAARKLFIAANKLDSEDPEPLMQFHNSYWREGLEPTANAVAALHYASDLAPQDSGLRMMSAVQYLRDGKLNQARIALAPIAYNPHGRGMSKVARAMMAKIVSGDGKGALAAGEAEERADTGE
jgi:hypothetical protein